jgi:hypothetical protein
MIFTKTLNTYTDEVVRSRTFILESKARDLSLKLSYIKNLYGNQLIKDLVG